MFSFSGRWLTCRQAGHDTREDQHRNSVADATLGDLLAEPHHEHRAGDQRYDRDEHHAETRGVEQPLCRHADRHAARLDRCQQQRAVTRVLRDLASPRFTFLLELLELRHHRAHQLHDDRRRDIRHHPERHHTHALERTARKHVEQPDDIMPRFSGVSMTSIVWFRRRSPRPRTEARCAFLHPIGLFTSVTLIFFSAISLLQLSSDQ
jgi:hypothetical protein